MRIIYVSPGYFPRIGGVEYVVKSVAERLASKGHEVTVVAGSPEAEAPGREEINGVEVLRWPTWAPGGAYHMPKATGKFAEAVAELCRGADVLHIHNIHAITAYYAWRGWRRCVGKVRLVVTPHYHRTGHTIFRRLLWIPWRTVVGRMLRSASVIHAVSEYEAMLLEEDFGVKPIVIMHGVDEDVLSYKWDPRGYAMYAGRIEKYKNIDLVAWVIAEMNRRYGTDLEFLVVGEGPYAERLRRNLERIGLKYSILPFQPRKRYLELLSHASLFMTLSRREAFGITPLEAVTIGVPTVITKPWGEHFKGIGRVLIVDADEPVSKLAEEVHRFLSQAKANANKRACTWDEIALEYIEKLYTI
ncbi:glycosyltransferase family 4 protein [Infirmifilum lucidum]|uniref:Glycosyltransferase family 4 protein n=1 Tax=Infirmifilum lucidum TaxID=2776706 RepID=A0A7L9FJT5_9CREN|nr:glycosyltransferase family 4 protein [Infirmifilum lucidum]QOJ79273.1 glycosyltransferase family 4 protein [Infirmifilum lucidum]